MSNTNVSTLGTILSRHGINYRDFPCRSGEFYFCTIPEKKLTFDLQYNENGLMRLWRFVGEAPASKAGRRCEYRASQYPYTVVGIEVTDEGDISFYAEQKVDINDSRNIARIDRMISGYVNLLMDDSLSHAL